MQKFSQSHYPFLDFFYALQEEQDGYKLDTSNYLLMLDAMEKGFGLARKQDLLDVCKTLWLKPGFNEKRFEQLFYEYLATMEKQLKKKLQKAAVLNNNSVTQNTSFSEIEATEEEATGEEEKAEIIEEMPDDREEKAEKKPNIETKVPQKMITIGFEQVKGEMKELEEEVDEDKVTKAIFDKIYILEGKYYPITARHLQQGWRSTRRLTRKGKKTEIDWKATIDKTAKSGGLLEFVKVPPLKNETQLIFFIDNSPSMIAFHDLAEQIYETSARGEKEGTAHRFYFDNVPQDHVFYDREQLEPFDIQRFKKEQTIIIVSDGGAARGHFEAERVQETHAFLKKLEYQNIIWLNPMPRNRWKNTSAMYISYWVPMFEIDRQDYISAIKTIRGKIKPETMPL